MDKSASAIAVFNKLASLYEQKFMNVDVYAAALDWLCRNSKPKLLELACGPGNITRYLLEKRPDLQILGTDLAPNMIALAQKNNPQAQFSLMDCRDLLQLKQSYDTIVCGFCLPYLSMEETAKLIADTAQILHPGGLFYLSTMEADYAQSGEESSSTGDKVFMHYYQADDLTAMLQKQGFEVVYEQRVATTGNARSAADLILIGQKTMTVQHRILIDAPAQKVWQVLTRSEFIAQWDELPENFTADALQHGSILEWEGYSRLTVTEFEPAKKLKMNLFLPKVLLNPAAYDLNYTYTLTESDGQTLLSIDIGDFSPIPDTQSYCDASIEFADAGGKKIKELSER